MIHCQTSLMLLLLLLLLMMMALSDRQTTWNTSAHHSCLTAVYCLLLSTVPLLTGIVSRGSCSDSREARG